MAYLSLSRDEEGNVPRGDGLVLNLITDLPLVDPGLKEGMQMRTTHTKVSQYHIQIFFPSRLQVRILYRSQPLVDRKFDSSGAVDIF